MQLSGDIAKPTSRFYARVWEIATRFGRKSLLQADGGRRMKKARRLHMADTGRAAGDWMRVSGDAGAAIDLASAFQGLGAVVPSCFRAAA